MFVTLKYVISSSTLYKGGKLSASSKKLSKIPPSDRNERAISDFTAMLESWLLSNSCFIPNSPTFADYGLTKVKKKTSFDS